MAYDILTITWKELKEIFVQRGSLRSGLTNLLIVIGIIGILFPIQFGREWITHPIGLISGAWLPLFMSMGLIADAFAGERERHTLETLLASRLSDQAILFGKMLSSILYGGGIGLAGMLLGALTANLAHPGIGFYPLGSFLGTVLFALLGITLVAGVGVLVSLHAGNVRQAYQRMSLGFLLIWLPLILAPQFLPEAWKLQIGQWLASANAAQLVTVFAVALLAADLIVIALARARFQRARLILD
jgi:ABC-2 type transport system permease protein